MSFEITLLILVLPCTVLSQPNAAFSPYITTSPQTTETSTELGPLGKCECAVFSLENPTTSDEPILIQNPMNVTCGDSGDLNCLNLCSALARAAKERGPQLLCSSVGHINNLKASIHSRICNAGKWSFTGLTSPSEICCHEHLVTPCKGSTETFPQNKL